MKAQQFVKKFSLIILKRENCENERTERENFPPCYFQKLIKFNK
jgi:hypothetical protein